MNDMQTQRIDDLLTGIQAKWGREALQPLSKVKANADFIPTGFQKLDMALGTGGIPKNRLTSLYGKPTCGMTTLTYSIITQAQANRLVTVYLDAPHIFDPEYAMFRHVDMDLLLLLRPETWEHTLEMLRDVVNVAVAGLLVIDTGISGLKAADRYRPLAAALQRSGRSCRNRPGQWLRWFQWTCQ